MPLDPANDATRPARRGDGAGTAVGATPAAARCVVRAESHRDLEILVRAAAAGRGDRVEPPAVAEHVEDRAGEPRPASSLPAAAEPGVAVVVPFVQDSSNSAASSTRIVNPPFFRAVVVHRGTRCARSARDALHVARWPSACGARSGSRRASSRRRRARRSMSLSPTRRSSGSRGRATRRSTIGAFQRVDGSGGAAERSSAAARAGRASASAQARSGSRSFFRASTRSSPATPPTSSTGTCARSFARSPSAEPSPTSSVAIGSASVTAPPGGSVSPTIARADARWSKRSSRGEPRSTRGNGRRTWGRSRGRSTRFSAWTWTRRGSRTRSWRPTRARTGGRRSIAGDPVRRRRRRTLRVEPPWSARRSTRRSSVLGAGPDADGRFRVGGDLLVSRDALASLEASLAGARDDEVGRAVDETLGAPGVALRRRSVAGERCAT